MFTFTGEGTVKRIQAHTGPTATRTGLLIEGQRPNAEGEPVPVHVPFVTFQPVGDDIEPGTYVAFEGHMVRPQRKTKTGRSYYLTENLITTIQAQPALSHTDSD